MSERCWGRQVANGNGWMVYEFSTRTKGGGSVRATSTEVRFQHSTRQIHVAPLAPASSSLCAPEASRTIEGWSRTVSAVPSPGLSPSTWRMFRAEEDGSKVANIAQRSSTIAASSVRRLYVLSMVTIETGRRLGGLLRANPEVVRLVVVETTDFHA
jgi:hypothetical protein